MVKFYRILQLQTGGFMEKINRRNRTIAMIVLVALVLALVPARALAVGEVVPVEEVKKVSDSNANKATDSNANANVYINADSTIGINSLSYVVMHRSIDKQTNTYTFNLVEGDVIPKSTHGPDKTEPYKWFALDFGAYFMDSTTSPEWNDIDLTTAYMGPIGSTDLTPISQNENFVITPNATHHALLWLAEDQPDFWTVSQSGDRQYAFTLNLKADGSDRGVNIVINYETYTENLDVRLKEMSVQADVQGGYNYTENSNYIDCDGRYIDNGLMNITLTVDEEPVTLSAPGGLTGDAQWFSVTIGNFNNNQLEPYYKTSTLKLHSKADFSDEGTALAPYKGQTALFDYQDDEFMEQLYAMWFAPGSLEQDAIGTDGTTAFAMKEQPDGTYKRTLYFSQEGTDFKWTVNFTYVPIGATPPVVVVPKVNDGVINGEDIKYTLVDLKKGQSIDIALGETPSDVTLKSEIYDAIKQKGLSEFSVTSLDENGNEVTMLFDMSGELKNVDMNLRYSLVPTVETENSAKEKFGADAKLFFIDFAHEGDFPAPMTMKIYVGHKYNTGETVYLYWFDSGNNNLLEKQELVVDSEGYITTKPITHASTYVVSNIEYAEPMPSPSTSPTPSTSEIPSSPKTGDSSFLYVWIAIVMGTAICAILIVRKRYAGN